MSRVVAFLRQLAGKSPRGVFGRPAAEAGKVPQEYFGKDLLEEFLDGRTALRVGSSWLDNALWHPDSGELQITFLDGHVGYYRPFSRAELVSFATAPSKGKWFHTHILAGKNPDGSWNHIKNYRPG